MLELKSKVGLKTIHTSRAGNWPEISHGGSRSMDPFSPPCRHLGSTSDAALVPTCQFQPILGLSLLMLVWSGVGPVRGRDMVERPAKRSTAHPRATSKSSPKQVEVDTNHSPVENPLWGQILRFRGGESQSSQDGSSSRQSKSSGPRVVSIIVSSLPRAMVGVTGGLLVAWLLEGCPGAAHISEGDRFTTALFLFSLLWFCIGNTGLLVLLFGGLYLSPGLALSSCGKYGLFPYAMGMIFGIAIVKSMLSVKDDEGSSSTVAP